MIKCFECIKLEHHNMIKWSQVADAVVIINGISYCYKHLNKELGWEE